MSFVRRPIAERLIRFLRVVELKKAGQALPGFADCPPEAFDRNIVEDRAAAVRADSDPPAFQKPREIGAGQLRPLFGDRMGGPE